jgi:predicted nucleic acid-binding protein
MPKSSVVVVDSSTALYTVLDYPLSSHVEAHWETWIDADVRISAPRLWINEVTSVIHKAFMLKEISEASAQDALNAALSLGVELFDEDITLCNNAFSFATRLEQLAAYDSFYLALAERLDAEFWTADKRLVNGARQLGATWVHWIGEEM